MASAVETPNIDWKCRHTWRKVAFSNTMWCLIGCSIGDIGTIAFFDFYNIALARYGHYGACYFQWPFNVNHP